ncbi:MAG: dTDP-4-dehydrorhamnose 3,5-epimerase family protein [Nitrospirae bacterium]|nr:dTDP-4-dehydrorhamnose 3,5-epimerase family protein [Nitrospirota bacterium]
MEGVIIRELNQFHDERGWLTEVFRDDETDFRPAMSYVSMTKPGIARGPHEHIEQSDYFCFFGEFRLYLWDNRKGSPTYGEKMTFDTKGRPCTAIVPPRVVHAYKNIGSGDGLVFNLPDSLFRGKGKALPVDEVRYEEDPESPYKID